MLGDYLSACAFVLVIGAGLAFTLNRHGYDFRAFDIIVFDLIGVGIFSISYGLAFFLRSVF